LGFGKKQSLFENLVKFAGRLYSQ